MTQQSKVLPQSFEQHLRDRRFFRARQKILMACSGGPDSVALVHLLNGVAAGHSLKLGILHFDHQLRPAAKSDAKFVRDLSKKLKIRFYLGTGNVKQEARRTKTSTEEAARKMRYGFFVKTAKRLGIKTVALAHTMDDQAETVLMRILQGTGLRGLQGIREKFRMGNVTLVRPLLDFTKKELLHFLRLKKIAFRKDESNDSEKFLRNRIRLELIPGLQRDFNPRVVEALSRIPAIAAREDSLIAELEEKAWKKTFKKIRGKKVELRRAAFLQCHPALQFRIVERALKKLDPRSGLSFEAWQRIRQGLVRRRFRCSLPKDIDFEVTPKNTILYKKGFFT